MANNVLFQGASYNATLTFSVTDAFKFLVPVPIVIDGFSNESILEVEEIDAVDVKRGLDGAIQASVMLKEYSAKATMFAGSPSLLALIAITEWQQYNALAVNGILTFDLIGINLQLIAEPIVITNLPQFSAKDSLQPVTVNFKGVPPINVPTKLPR